MNTSVCDRFFIENVVTIVQLANSFGNTIVHRLQIDVIGRTRQ
jgi:hypothetical protein